MDKLNTTEINEALKDVRKAYRLLALYQTRLLDIIKYISNGYNVSFKSGWSKFSNAASHGNRASIDKWSWDWLSLYLYEFYLGELKIGEDNYYIKIVHQADTGFYDVNTDEKISKLNSAQFSDVASASTRLFFIVVKNQKGCPIEHVLEGNLTAQNNRKIIKGNWLAVPYNLQRFSSQSLTDIVLNEFNVICKETFGVDLMTIKE